MKVDGHGTANSLDLTIAASSPSALLLRSGFWNLFFFTFSNSIIYLTIYEYMNINFSTHATFLQRQSWLLLTVFSKAVCNFCMCFSNLFLRAWGWFLWFLWHFFSKGSCEPPVVEHGQVSGKGNDNSWVGTVSCANGFTLVKLK